MTATNYIGITNRLKMGIEIRNDAEELIRINAERNEIRKILFVADLVKEYAESIIEQSAAEMEKDEEDFSWYLINAHAKSLKTNINNTITRLKTHLYFYHPEKNVW